MAVRIDFYVVKDQDPQAREQVACRLVNKAFQAGHRICLLAEDANQAKRMDQLLWTFNPGSFIPHTLEGEKSESGTPVVITSTGCEESRDVLISLGEAGDGYLDRFERVAEIVGGPEDERKKARERFRSYRDKGYALHSHDVS